MSGGRKSMCMIHIIHTLSLTVRLGGGVVVMLFFDGISSSFFNWGLWASIWYHVIVDTNPLLYGGVGVWSDINWGKPLDKGLDSINAAAAEWRLLKRGSAERIPPNYWMPCQRVVWRFKTTSLLTCERVSRLLPSSDIHWGCYERQLTWELNEWFKRCSV